MLIVNRRELIPMLIDIHRHYSMVEGDLERYLERARLAGIEKIGLSTCGPLFGQYDNEGVIAAREQYPDMFIGFGYVKLGIDGPDKVDWLHTMGFEALKMIVPAVAYDDPVCLPIYQRAEALGVEALRSWDLAVDVRGRKPLPVTVPDV